MELDFDKYCVVDRSPTTVLPNRKSTKNGNDTLQIEKHFAEISFNRYRSASCRDVRSRKSDHESNEVLKRGSVYQSSKEIKLLYRTDSDVVRKKIEFSRVSAKSTSSFGIIDSLCSSDEDCSLLERNRSSVMSISEQSTSTVCQNEVYDPITTSEFDGTTKNNVKSLDFQKSLSAKLSLPRSPARSESDGSNPSIPKTRFSPVKRMFEPFVKSKSHKSPLSFVNENSLESISGPIGKNCNKTICKTLLNDLSDNLNQCSPAHLHGILKLENKTGVPRFEFSIKSPEDVYVAKAWNVGNALTRDYTFHSLHQMRKSNASGRGFKDGNKESPIVGQMQVSCYLSTELKCAKTKTKIHFDSSPFQPLAVEELHPALEIAAIVMQIPFEKRESVKYKDEDRKIELKKQGIFDKSSYSKLHVVIPSGNHSLPSSENRGPSSVLDRWRLGGGCECGGWDMACPLIVFRSTNNWIDEQNPSQLLVQGRTDNIPGFSMRIIEDGKYAVDFHAQLSSLQAFSICVAILHAKASKSKQILQSDSLRVFPEEQITNFIDVIAEEEKYKGDKKMQSFVLNPPFSPIARV